MMDDQILVCVQCDESFTFSHRDQERFRQRGFDPPRRCPVCRQHKVRMDAANDGRDDRRRVRPRRRPNHHDELSYQ